MTNDKPVNVKKMGVLVLGMATFSYTTSLANAAPMAEAGLVLIFFLVAAAVVFLAPTSLIAAELTTGWPQTGGIYVWVSEAFGARTGFMALWLQWITHVIGIPSFVSYLAATAIFAFEPKLANNKLFLVITIAAIVWIMTSPNFFGVAGGATLSSIGQVAAVVIPTIILIIAMVVFLGSGGPSQINFGSVGNFFPNLSTIGVLALATSAYFTFSGTEVTATYIESVDNPRRTYPRAVALGALLMLLSMIPVSLAVAVVIPNSQLSLLSGVSATFKAYFAPWGMEWVVTTMSIMIGIGGIVASVTFMLGPAQGMLEAAHQGQIPAYFKKVNRKGAPVRLLVTQGILVTVVSLVFVVTPSVSSSFWLIIVMNTQGLLVMYVLMFAAGVKLKYSHPHVHREFKVPGGNAGMWLVAGIGIIFAVGVLIVGFIPPPQIGNMSIFTFELILFAGIIIMFVLPFALPGMRRVRGFKVDTGVIEDTEVLAQSSGDAE